MSHAPSEPGLCLVAQAAIRADELARIEAALTATQAVTLILAPPDGGALDAAAAGALVGMAQKRNVAVLLADDVAAARALHADGVHLSFRPEIEDAYEAARTTLGPDAIIGAVAGASRHDAMTLGEAGADYVAFARLTDAYDPQQADELQQDLLSWWADVFVVPAVAFDAETPDDVHRLVRLGADFVAVRLPPQLPIEQVAAWAKPLVAALRAPADAD